MRSCIIVALPETVAREVLTGWLELKHIVRLDSAFCEAKTRAVYLNTAYAEGIVYPVQCDARYSFSAPWCMLRDVQVDGVCLQGDLASNATLREKYLTLYGKKFQWVKYCERFNQAVTYSTNILATIRQECYNLNRIALSGLADGGRVTIHWDDALTSLMQSCARLTTLHLIRVPVTKLGLGVALSHCKSLVELQLWLPGVEVPAEAAIPSLTSLDMRSCTVHDSVMISIGNLCPNIRNLYVFNQNDNAITDTGVQAVLLGCPLLRDTGVEYAKDISQELRVELAKRRDYTTLNFARWQKINSPLAEGVLTVCPSLVEFACCGGFGWWEVDDATLAVCAQHCLLLERITVVKCASVTAGGPLPLLYAGNNLREVVFASCERLNDEVVLAIARHCPRLEVCRVFGSKSLTDRAVVLLAEGCPLMRDVTVGGLGIHDVSLVALATNCPSLRKLQVTSCMKITVQGVRALAVHCKTLQSVDLPPHLATSEVSQLFGAGTVVYTAGRDRRG
jgi:hypothetical protein